MKLYYIPKEELDKITDLDVLTDALRLNILYMVQQAGSGHLGGSLSSLDIMIDLFYRKMKPEDIFISSKGHDAPALYAVLQAKGIIPFDSIHSFRRPGGLPGHPTIDVPGILFNTGSLGMGISKANGLAKADKIKGINRNIYVLIGDGEAQEGQIFESLWHQEDNVHIYLDYNGFQLSRETALHTYFANNKRIKVIISTKGHGINFMEGNNKYHAGALSNEDYNNAVAELRDSLPDVRVIKTDKIPYQRPEKPHQLASHYPYILDEVGMNEKVVVLDADLEPDCGLILFKEKNPDRFIECGIREQDMVSMATGFSQGGFIPIVHSFAAFLCRRANEQIYNACLERRHIVFVGHFAGLLPVGAGTSHECLEDIALMKTMPNMTVLVPETGEQLRSAILWAVNEATNPVYVSIRCWGIEGMRR